MDGVGGCKAVSYCWQWDVLLGQQLQFMNILVALKVSFWFLCPRI